jgi:hypothetical protein
MVDMKKIRNMRFTYGKAELWTIGEEHFLIWAIPVFDGATFVYPAEENGRPLSDFAVFIMDGEDIYAAIHGYAQSKLAELLKKLDVPKQRAEDLGWLSRNLGIRNGNKPGYARAMKLIEELRGDKK